LGHCTRDSAKDLSHHQRLQSLGRFAALVSKGVTESRAATKRCGGRWPESQNYEYARTSWGAGATGSGRRIHRAIESATSVRCDEPESAPTECDFVIRKGKPGDGWRWPRDGCTGPDTGAHIRGLQRVVWNKPSSRSGTAAGARQQKSLVEQAVAVLHGNRVGHPWKARLRAATKLAAKNTPEHLDGKKERVV